MALFQGLMAAQVRSAGNTLEFKDLLERVVASAELYRKDNPEMFKVIQAAVTDMSQKPGAKLKMSLLKFNALGSYVDLGAQIEAGSKLAELEPTQDQLVELKRFIAQFSGPASALSPEQLKAFSVELNSRMKETVPNADSAKRVEMPPRDKAAKRLE